MFGECQFRPPGRPEPSCDEMAAASQWDHRWKQAFPMCDPHAKEVRRYNEAARHDLRDSVVGWVIALVVGGVLLAACIQNNFQSSPQEYRPGGGGGYENPAPGNDGSYDCAPGQGPVVVGGSDPGGLDRDGDGIGCE